MESGLAATEQASGAGDGVQCSKAGVGVATTVECVDDIGSVCQPETGSDHEPDNDDDTEDEDATDSSDHEISKDLVNGDAENDDYSDLSDTSSSDGEISTSDTEDEGEPARACVGRAHNTTAVFPPRSIDTIEEVCECEHSHCQEWLRQSVRQAKKETEEVLQYDITELKEKVAEAEKQLRRKDLLLGEKVIAAQRMQRELEELKTKLRESSQQHHSQGISVLHRNGTNQIPPAGDSSDTSSSSQSLASGGLRESDQPERSAEPDRTAAEDGKRASSDSKQVSLKLQFQQLALVANQAALKDLQAANEQLSQSLTKARERNQQLERKPEASEGASAEQESSDQLQPSGGAQSSDQETSTLLPCGNCILHQKLLERERTHLLSEMTNILHVWQDSDGAESEVLIAKVHCELATKLQERPPPQDNGLQDNSPKQQRLAGIGSRAITQAERTTHPLALCGRCQQLTIELFEMKQSSLLEKMSSQDTCIGEEERRLAKAGQQHSSSLLTLRREREDLMLELKQLVSRHVPLSASGESDSQRHRRRSGGRTEIQTALDQLRAESQDILSSIQVVITSDSAPTHGSGGQHTTVGGRSQSAKHGVEDETSSMDRLLARLDMRERQLATLKQVLQQVQQ